MVYKTIDVKTGKKGQKKASEIFNNFQRPAGARKATAAAALPAGAVLSNAPAVIKPRRGYWEVYIYLGKTPAGKPRRISKRILTKPGAKDFKNFLEANRAALLAEAIAAEQAPAGAGSQGAGITLAALITLYLDSNRQTWSPKTYRNKEHHLRYYVLSRIGDIPLSMITNESMQRYQNDLLRSGLAETTAAGIMRTLSALFKQAANWDYLPKNPAKGLTPLKAAPEAPPAIWDRAAVLKALAAPAPLWLRLLLTTAIRPEELQALRWDRIDLEKGTIQISRVAYYSGGEWREREGAKSAAGRRIIPLDRTTLLLLRTEYVRLSLKHRDRAPETPPAGYVIPARRGSGITPQNTLRLWLKRFCEKTGLPQIPLYHLRHSSITYLLDNGAGVKTVAARAGHARITTTLTHYAQATDAAALAAAALFDTNAAPVQSAPEALADAQEQALLSTEQATEPAADPRGSALAELEAPPMQSAPEAPAMQSAPEAPAATEPAPHQREPRGPRKQNRRE